MRGRTRGRTAGPALRPGQLALAWQSASLLLAYPDEQLVGRTPLLREAAAALPGPVGGPLTTFLDVLDRTPLHELETAYVDTFDTRKRCCPFLTYVAHGDTRRRGAALLRFTSAYKRAGVALAPDELPDHLAVVLEFGATTDLDAGWELLLEHRAGVEVLRLALRDDGAPWAPVLDAVSATLPPLKGDEREAVARLVAAGPPAEEVGLAPFPTADVLPPGAGPAVRPTLTLTPTGSGRR